MPPDVECRFREVDPKVVRRFLPDDFHVEWDCPIVVLDVFRDGVSQMDEVLRLLTLEPSTDSSRSCLFLPGQSLIRVRWGVFAEGATYLREVVFAAVRSLAGKTVLDQLRARRVRRVVYRDSSLQAAARLYTDSDQKHFSIMLDRDYPPDDPHAPFLIGHELAHTFACEIERGFRRRFQHGQDEEIFCDMFSLVWLAVSPSPRQAPNYVQAARLAQLFQEVVMREELLLEE